MAAPRYANFLTIVCLAVIILDLSYKTLIFIIFIHSEMKNQEESSISNPRKMRNVILITDNRDSPQTDKNGVNTPIDKSHIDFRSSGFKQTQVDPLEFPKNQFNCIRDDELIAELNRRIVDLESRVQILEGRQSLRESQSQEKIKVRKHKKRRRNFQMKKDRICPHCAKNYGTETALKYHLKLKHPEISRKEAKE